MYRILVTYIDAIIDNDIYSEWLIDGHKKGEAQEGLTNLFETDNLEEAREKRDRYREQFMKIAYYDIVQVIE